MTRIPTISELYNAILNDLQTQYGVNISAFGKVFLRALAASQAGMLKMFYLSNANVQKNIFVDTAEPEAIGGTLERFGRVKLNRNPFPARAGKYTLTVTGQVGATIPAQTTFKSNDDALNAGALFILDSVYVMVSTSDTVTVRALEAGVASRLAIGNELTATAPIALVDAIATVATEVIEPTSAESVEDYRAKAIDAYRLEPQGGAATDYRLWAADAQGVKQSYAYAKTGGVAEINLFVEATLADSTDGKGTPSPSLLAAVEAVVEYDPDVSRPLAERGRRPLQAIVYFLPVTIKNVDITITGFTTAPTSVRTSIQNALTNEINKIRPFVAACDVLSEKNDVLDTNKIISIIYSAQPGSTFTNILLEISGSPALSFTFLNGDIPYVNSINFV